MDGDGKARLEGSLKYLSICCILSISSKCTAHSREQSRERSNLAWAEGLICLHQGWRKIQGEQSLFLLLYYTDTLSLSLKLSLSFFTSSVRAQLTVVQWYELCSLSKLWQTLMSIKWMDKLRGEWKCGKRRVLLACRQNPKQNTSCKKFCRFLSTCSTVAVAVVKSQLHRTRQISYWKKENIVIIIHTDTYH